MQCKYIEKANEKLKKIQRLKAMVDEAMEENQVERTIKDNEIQTIFMDELNKHKKLGEELEELINKIIESDSLADKEKEEAINYLDFLI